MGKCNMKQHITKINIMSINVLAWMYQRWVPTHLSYSAVGEEWGPRVAATATGAGRDGRRSSEAHHEEWEGGDCPIYTQEVCH